MSATTAERAAAISIRPSHILNLGKPDVVDRFIRRFSLPPAQDTVIWPETVLRDVRSPSAPWLEAVQQRISDSIAEAGTTATPEGKYLEPAVANSAISVLNTTSDILPGEPFIYSSRSGDLVAEFEAPYGKLTTIISESFLIAFAVMGDVPYEKHIDLENSTSKVLRSEIRKITKALSTGQVHGLKVES